MTDRLGDHGSLRNWGKPDPPPRRSLESGLDQVFRDAERAAAQPARKEITVERPTGDIHGPQDIAKRIKSLAADGVPQITDGAAVKAMKPEEIIQAQREGRLLQYMSGIDPFAEERAAYQRGRSDANKDWHEALASDD